MRSQASSRLTTDGMRSHSFNGLLIALAPAFEMISSCAAVTPLVPTAPITSVPRMIGTPPAKGFRSGLR